jgi:extracellular elastinolytic metalloproteinase
MLNEMYWTLVKKLRFSSNWLDSTQRRGNIVALKVIMGGLMRQPCNPSFTQARNAILRAEKDYYNEEYNCQIWIAFAKRGLGVDSNQVGFLNGFKVPKRCEPPFSVPRRL